MTVLTADQRTLLETRLTEAENAYHKIMLGGGVRVVVDQNGERVEFTAANAQRLNSYIFSLKSQLGIAGIVGPMRPWF